MRFLHFGDLVIYDAESRKELKRLNIGHGGAGILMDAECSRAFVSCSPDNYVAVVDLKTLTVTKSMSAETLMVWSGPVELFPR
jgi:hypothetical protein